MKSIIESNLGDSFIYTLILIWCVPFLNCLLVIFMPLSYFATLFTFVSLCVIFIIIDSLLVWADVKDEMEMLGRLCIKIIIIFFNCHCLYHPATFLFAIISLMFTIGFWPEFQI